MFHISLITNAGKEIKIITIAGDTDIFIISVKATFHRCVNRFKVYRIH